MFDYDTWLSTPPKPYQEHYEDEDATYDQWLATSMELTGHEKVDTTLFKVSFRKSEAVEVDDLLLPEAYKVATWKADKKRLKEDLKNGLEILGAELVERKNLNIY